MGQWRGPIPAAIPSPITDHLALTGGFFWGHVTTFGQFNSGKGLPGTTLTAEQDLGLTDQVYQPRIELMFRLQKRGRLQIRADDWKFLWVIDFPLMTFD